MSEIEVDVAIVGTGTAGMSAYRQARRYTGRIALIEGGAYGTTCARVGCMPSKLLIAPAEAVHRASRLDAFGIEASAPRVDGRRVLERVRAERDRFVGFVKDAVERFDDEHVLQATARFESAHRLALSDGRTVQAKRIVLAVGSRAQVPELFDAVRERVLVNDDVFELEDLPSSMAVFGGGIIGLELGQALHRLGVRVELFGRGGDVGPLSDPAVREYAVRALREEFPFHPDAQVSRVEPDGDGVRIVWREEDGDERSERFDRILAATGRRSNLDRMNIEAAGLETDPRGLPVFDTLSMQCGDSHVFVAGDANGDVPLLHEAADEGRIAGENAVRYPEVVRHPRRTPLAIVFTDPQIAIAGESRAQLIARGASFRAGEVSYEDQGRARVMLRNKGLVRIYADERSGMLLGAELFAPEAEHLSHLLAWSVASRLSVSDVLERPFYHPVLEEGLRTALRDLHRELGMAPKPPPRCIDCGPGG